MTSEVQAIFSRFYLRVTDYHLTGLDESLVNDMLSGYMKAVISKPYIRKLFTSIKIDDDVEEVEYFMRKPQDDDSDRDFVEEVLCLGMIIEWVGPKYHSTLNTAQFFSNKEQSFFSQANHMQQLKEMYEKSQTDLRKLIRDRGYILSVINGVE